MPWLTHLLAVIDHIIALGERHLVRILLNYATYYNGASYCLIRAQG